MDMIEGDFAWWYLCWLIADLKLTGCESQNMCLDFFVLDSSDFSDELNFQLLGPEDQRNCFSSINGVLTCFEFGSRGIED